jgi:hypothetical protein
MKPLPAQSSIATRPSGSAAPKIPAMIPPLGEYSQSNRRATPGAGQRAYPALLLASTALAAVFCFLYITKPVIMTTPGTEGGQTESPVAEMPAQVAGSPAAPAELELMPSRSLLPGEKDNTPGMSKPPTTADTQFEQTNLRIQHILTAEAPNGHRAKINIDVPVLYQSRHLRWTPAEVADARELLARLADYQEKSRVLRAEGSGLLEAWNQLVARSIPSSHLRADSPSLPENQQGSLPAPRPPGLDTTELIQIQPAGK